MYLCRVLFGLTVAPVGFMQAARQYTTFVHGASAIASWNFHFALRLASLGVEDPGVYVVVCRF